ncbi:hypothetical protein AVMA1855_06825 [Acidovorax sp. SUPP1855]|uniref:hypothetical protein n=1 Tax=Acidovorax sp. SUPP1855 TaxID=431774 RepID=UPI0023DE2B0B|nr:hypothetical protein [Acidovorax sp. SUPP1855]GKS83839.1 hypothetical protein AVMA1855_06825 [Acidovorax sp. SUPP1855]
MSETPLRLSAEESKFLTKVTTLGSATALPVVMSAGEFAKLIGMVYYDTERFSKLEKIHPGLAAKINPGFDYYCVPDGWFEAPIQLGELEHVALMRQAAIDIPDFFTYLRCLSELHKRRKKYTKILSAQPMPTMVQVSPRSLMEYGHVEPEALASWLTWRKFFYDLDNRSAQETGYLFEPILAAAIGGEPKGNLSKPLSQPLGALTNHELRRSSLANSEVLRGSLKAHGPRLSSAPTTLRRDVRWTAGRQCRAGHR